MKRLSPLAVTLIATVLADHIVDDPKGVEFTRGTTPPATSDPAIAARLQAERRARKLAAFNARRRK